MANPRRQISDFGLRVLMKISHPESKQDQLEPSPTTFNYKDIYCDNVEAYRLHWQTFAINEAATANDGAKQVFYPTTVVQERSKGPDYKYTLTVAKRKGLIPQAGIVTLTDRSNKVTAFVEQGNANGSKDKIVIQTLTPFQTICGSVESNNLKLELLKTTTPLKRIYDSLATLSVDERFFRTLLSGTPYYKEQKQATNEYKSELSEKLNDSQARVVEKYKQMEKGLMIVVGPPGTGKTTTILALIEAELANHKNAQLLIATTSNQALQHLLERYLKNFGHKKEKIAFVISSGRIDGLDSGLKKMVVHSALEEEKRELTGVIEFIKNNQDPQRKEEISQMINALALSDAKTRDSLKDIIDHLDADKIDFSRVIQLLEGIIAGYASNIKLLQQIKDNSTLQARILFTTLTMIPTIKTENITAAILDEAGQATEGETAIALSTAGEKLQRCVLVGDHHQLPATLQNIKAKKWGYEKSLMERLAEDLSYPHTYWLTEQHRCAASLMEIANRLAYGKRIKTAKYLRDNPRFFLQGQEKDHALFDCQDSFFDVPGEEKKEGTSFYNEKEIEVAVNILKTLKSIGTNLENRVVILTPYAAQRARLLKRLQQEGLWALLKTVDGDQGNEADLYLVSFVRANHGGYVGHTSNLNRLIVLLTRAKAARICLGDIDTLCKKNGALAKMVKIYFEKNACFDIDQLGALLKNQRPAPKVIKIERPYIKSLLAWTRKVEIGAVSRENAEELIAECKRICIGSEKEIKSFAHRLLAKIYLQRGELQAALNKYSETKFAEDSAEHVLVLRERTKIYYKLGDYSSINAAIAILTALIAAAKGSPQDRRRLAKCYMKLGQYNSAMAILEQETAKDSAHLYYQLDKARCYMDMRDFKKAHDILEKFYAAGGKENSACCLLFIKCLHETGKYKAAEKIYLECIDRGMGEDNDKFALARLDFLTALGKEKEVFALFSDGGPLHHGKYFSRQAKAYCAFRRYDEAVRIYQQQLADPGLAPAKKVQVILDLVYCYKDMHQPDKALLELQRIAPANDSEQQKRRLAVAHCYIELRDQPSARAELISLLKDYPQDYYLRHEIAICLSKLREKELSLAELKEICEASPETLLYRLTHRGMLASEDEATPVVAAAESKELNIDFCSIKQKKSLLFTHLRLKEDKRAEEVIASITDDNAENIQCKAFYFYKKGDISNALNLCGFRVADFPVLHILIGIIKTNPSASNKSKKDGINHLHTALELYPYSYEASYALIIALLEQHKNKRALPKKEEEAVRGIIARFPCNAILQINGLSLLFKTGDKSLVTPTYYKELTARFKNDRLMLDRLQWLFEEEKLIPKQVVPAAQQTVEPIPLALQDANCGNIPPPSSPTEIVAEETTASTCKSRILKRHDYIEERNPGLLIDCTGPFIAVAVNPNLSKDILSVLYEKATEEKAKVEVYGGYLTDQFLKREVSNDVDIATNLTASQIRSLFANKFSIYQPDYSPVPNTDFLTFFVDPKIYGVKKIEIHCYKRNDFPTLSGSYQFNALKGTVTKDGNIHIENTPAMQSHLATIIALSPNSQPQPAEKTSPLSVRDDILLWYEAINGLAKIPGSSLTPAAKTELNMESSALTRNNSDFLSQVKRKRLMKKIHKKLSNPEDNPGRFFEFMVEHNLTHIYGEECTFRYKRNPRYLQFVQYMLLENHDSQLAVSLECLLAFPEITEAPSSSLYTILDKYYTDGDFESSAYTIEKIDEKIRVLQQAYDYFNRQWGSPKAVAMSAEEKEEKTFLVKKTSLCQLQQLASEPLIIAKINSAIRILQEQNLDFNNPAATYLSITILFRDIKKIIPPEMTRDTTISSKKYLETQKPYEQIYIYFDHLTDGVCAFITNQLGTIIKNLDKTKALHLVKIIKDEWLSKFLMPTADSFGLNYDLRFFTLCCLVEILDIVILQIKYPASNKSVQSSAISNSAITTEENGILALVKNLSEYCRLRNLTVEHLFNLYKLIMFCEKILVHPKIKENLNPVKYEFLVNFSKKLPGHDNSPYIKEVPEIIFNLFLELKKLKVKTPAESEESLELFCDFFKIIGHYAKHFIPPTQDLKLMFTWMAGFHRLMFRNDILFGRAQWVTDSLQEEKPNTEECIQRLHIYCTQFIQISRNNVQVKRSALCAGNNQAASSIASSSCNQTIAGNNATFFNVRGTATRFPGKKPSSFLDTAHSSIAASMRGGSVSNSSSSRSVSNSSSSSSSSSSGFQPTTPFLLPPTKSILQENQKSDEQQEQNNNSAFSFSKNT